MKTFHKYLFLFFVAWVCSESVFAQQDYLRFDNLSIKDGLSQSSINCILQDKKGFLWFGTQDGLNRYDGYNFTIYNHHPLDSNCLSDNYIHAIEMDSAGYLWIGTDGGLNRFDPGNQSFKHYNHEPGNPGSISDNTVWSLLEDSQERLWIGTSNGGLCLFDRGKEKFTTYRHHAEDENSLSSDAVRCLFEDSKGKLWIGTAGGGLNLFDPESETFESFQYSSGTGSISGNFIWDIHEDRKNRLWIGTNNGISLLYPEKSTENQQEFISIQKNKHQPNGLSHNIIRSVFQNESGEIWMGTEGGGLNKLINPDAHHSQFIFLSFTHDPNYPNSISNNLVQTIFKDRTGSLWIGTYNGLSKFEEEKQSFIHYRKTQGNNSLNDNNVWSFFEDHNDVAWVGTRGGLNRLNRKNGRFAAWSDFNESPHFLNNKSVLSLFKSSDGALWLGTVDGLFKASLSPNGKDVLSIDQVNYCDRFFKKDIENRIYEIKEDQYENLWIGTRFGLCRWDKQQEKWKLFQKENAALPDNVIRAIHEDKKGNLWLGTDGGLVKAMNYHSDSLTFKTYQNKKNDLGSLSNNMVTSIWEDAKGMLWMGTYGGGINRFDPVKERFERFTEKNGLSNNAVYGVLGDKEGNLWISTNKGLSTFNPRSGNFSNYEENDGLQSNEFNIGAFFKNVVGEMYFGGINGFNVFHPEQVKPNKIPPKMAITNFLLFNKSVQPGPGSPLAKAISFTSEITLPWRENNFSIEYAALHYSFPAKNRYAYKMVGFDHDWNHVGNRRMAHYTNLDAGEYEFLVKGSNSDGVWSEEVATVKIIITPPYWATWWFRIAMIGGFLGGVFGIYRRRVHLIREQRDLLETQVQERTTEVMRQKAKIETQKAAIEQEKDKVEKLLLNIFPQETVDELKSKGKASARNYRYVSVMFTDFRNFTQIAESLRPQELVTELDSYFVKFDEIIQQHNLEKIKTIGDAYMCAGGVPIRNKSNPIDVVLAGLKIQQHMEALKEIKKDDDKPHWELRIGIHTGEAIAGVVGIKRFAYDIWGDTVNVANRMEQSGEVGKVNISGKTHAAVKEFFQCTYRGKVMAKNKGLIDMYYVDRIKPELSVKGEGKIPNDMFWEYVNLKLYSAINYTKAEKYILKRLRKELPPDLHYHAIDHTLDVCEAVQRIGKEEGIKGEDLFLLKTAALFHDAGFVKKYTDNEQVALAMAHEMLPEFGYTPEQINTIGEIIMSTRIPQQPKNHLEEIMCDADLDYLGRDDFFSIGEKLKKEFLAYGIVQDNKTWDELQIKFLTHHSYFTAASRRMRAEKKAENLSAVKKRLKEGKYA